MWAYHSYVSMDNDLNAGLMGPTFVYASGMMNVSIASAREFPLIYMDYNESNSFMSSINAAKFNVSTQSSGGPQPMLGNGYGNFSIWNPQLTNYNSSSALTTTQAPLFHTLNGGAFANNAPFEMCVNEKAIWYVMALGSASHTFHMHGNSFQRFGQNMASIGMWTVYSYYRLLDHHSADNFMSEEHRAERWHHGDADCEYDWCWGLAVDMSRERSFGRRDAGQLYCVSERVSIGTTNRLTSWKIWIREKRKVLCM